MLRTIITIIAFIICAGIVSAATHIDVTSAVNQKRKIADGTNGGVLYLGNAQSAALDCSTDWQTSTARLVAKGCATTGDIVLNGETNIMVQGTFGKTTAGAVTWDCSMDFYIKSINKYFVARPQGDYSGTGQAANHYFQIVTNDTTSFGRNWFVTTYASPSYPTFDTVRMRCHNDKPLGSDTITFTRVSLVNSFR